VKKELMPSFLSKMVDEKAFEAEVATQRSMTFAFDPSSFGIAFF